MPALVGVIFALLSTGLLLSKPQNKENEVISWPQKRGWQQIGVIFASLVLYALLLPWIGYLLATALFLTGLLRAMGKVRWRSGLIFGAVVSASTHVIFKIWLNMPLPAGFLGI